MNKIEKRNSFVNGIRKNGSGDYTVRACLRMPDGKIREIRANVRTVEEGKKKIEETKALLRSESRSSKKFNIYYKEI